MNSKKEQELKTFVERWDESSNKNTFIHFKDYLNGMAGVTLAFIARPGITYSLRAAHSKQKGRELFVMVDVIEDVSRWLSICFYGDMITDPDHKGDAVPGGLLGEDAICFDLEEQDEALVHYIEKRLDEACRNAVAD